MSTPSSGTISASQINTEFGRSSSATMSIYNARNGTYGAINAASGKRPTANGQNGYSWSHWYSYTHNASYPYVTIQEAESTADTNIRIYAWNNYGVNYISERWYFFAGTWDLAADAGVTIRMGDQIQALWGNWGWGPGSTWTEKRIDSNLRGRLYTGDGPTQTQVYTSVYPLSGEVLQISAWN